MRPSFGRRAFIAGAVAVGLAACGGDGGDGEEAGTDGDGADQAGVAPDDRPVGEAYRGPSDELDADTFIVVQRFPSSVLVPGEVRLPHSLSVDAEFVNDGPLTLGAQVVDIDGNPVGERITAVRRDVTPSAYYVWRPVIEEPGVYGLVIDGGPADGAAFQVVEPGQVLVPKPGEALGGFDTPTPGAPGGVDPICTREPACPFHSVTLAEALSVGRNVAYLVGTPAFCSTGTCAPALEAMVELEGEFAGDFVFVHAEVFTDLTAQELTPAIEATNLSYEPALFITDADGVIVERLDAIWGVDELRERLQLALA